jgi:hypothetical protein
VTAIDTARSVVTHRGMSCLELHRLLGELQREVRYLTGRAEQATAMEARLDEQAKTICSLREQLDQAKAIRDDVHAKAGRVDEAEARARAAERQLAEQTEELVALRQFKANVNSMSSQPLAGPKVPPADRFETGSPVRLGASPLAATNPAHVPAWVRSEDDTVPVPAVQAEEVES